MLATRDKDNSLIAVQLTVDLKPDLPSIHLSLSLITHSKCYVKLSTELLV